VVVVVVVVAAAAAAEVEQSLPTLPPHPSIPFSQKKTLMMSNTAPRHMGH
jgi:hypothetical protein